MIDDLNKPQPGSPEKETGGKWSFLKKGQEVFKGAQGKARGVLERFRSSGRGDGKTVMNPDIGVVDMSPAPLTPDQARLVQQDQFKRTQEAAEAAARARNGSGPFEPPAAPNTDLNAMKDAIGDPLKPRAEDAEKQVSDQVMREAKARQEAEAAQRAKDKASYDKLMAGGQDEPTGDKPFGIPNWVGEGVPDLGVRNLDTSSGSSSQGETTVPSGLRPYDHQSDSSPSGLNGNGSSNGHSESREPVTAGVGGPSDTEAVGAGGAGVGTSVIRSGEGGVSSGGTGGDEVSDLSGDDLKVPDRTPASDGGALWRSVTQRTPSADSDDSPRVETPPASPTGREAGDPTAYDAYTKRHQELQDEALKPGGWVDQEAGAAEAWKQAEQDKAEKEAQATREAEERERNDREERERRDARWDAVERSQARDPERKNVLSQVDQAQEDTRDRLAQEEEARAKADREASGARWSSMDDNESDEDKARRQAAGQVDQNAINDVDRVKAEIAERERVRLEEEARAQADREASGQRWQGLDRADGAGQSPEGQPRHESVLREEQRVADEVARIRELEAAAAAEVARRNAEAAEARKHARDEFWRGVTDRLPVRGITPDTMRRGALNLLRSQVVTMGVAGGLELAMHLSGQPSPHGVEKAILIPGIAAGVTNLIDQVRRNVPRVNAELDSRSRDAFDGWYNNTTNRILGAEYRRAGVTDQAELRRLVGEKAELFKEGSTATDAEKEHAVREALAHGGLEASVGASADDLARAMENLPSDLVQRTLDTLDISTAERLRDKLKPHQAKAHEKVGAMIRSLSLRKLGTATVVGGVTGYGIHELLGLVPGGDVSPDDPNGGARGPEPPSGPVEGPTLPENPLLRDLPTIDQKFPTPGIDGQNSASLDGWMKAEVAKAIKEYVAQDPENLRSTFGPAIEQRLREAPTGFMLGNPPDEALADLLAQSDRFKELFEPNGQLHSDVLRVISEKNPDLADKIVQSGGDLRFQASAEDTYRLPDVKSLITRMLNG